LIPNYDNGGELYLGMSDVSTPENLSLLFQVAEGTSNPDFAGKRAAWSRLDGDRWTGDEGPFLLHDSTLGLVQSGVVELALPTATAESTRLPKGLYWLRVATASHAAAVADTFAIYPHATVARFDDRDNARAHYDAPLPARSIDRLVKPVSGVVRVEQPYASFGGRPDENPSTLNTRVSERLRHRNRALTPWDYEHLVLDQFPEVYKAKCIRTTGAAWLGTGPRPAGSDDGSRGRRVDLVVIPDLRRTGEREASSPRASAALLETIRAYIQARAAGTAIVRVRNAHYVRVFVHANVRFVDGADEGLAMQQLDRALVKFLSPWAFDDSADLTIGGRIYATSIIDFIDRQPYVDYVANLEFGRDTDETGLVWMQPDVAEYHVAAYAPDEVLVSAAEHWIDPVRIAADQRPLLTGINYMRIGLSFRVRAMRPDEVGESP
jgi:hypothetical protein